MMKRILILALFLLSLWPSFFDNSYHSTSAQNFAYENGSYWIPDIEVTGEDPDKVTCDACGGRFSDDETFNQHLKYSNACSVYYGWPDNGDVDDDDNTNKDQNNDNDLGFEGQDFCPLCNRPYDYCNCSGVIVPGTSPSSDSWIIIVPSTMPEDDNLCNTDSIGTEVETTQTDTATYHHCLCLITFNTRSRQNAIDNNPQMEAINDKFYNFAKSLKRHIAFPETIQQGNHETCVSAALQKYLAENFPDDYIDCAISLAETREYKKWNLKIPETSYIDIISETDIINGNKNYEDCVQKGIEYTSIDMLFQTAIQNWYNDKKREQGHKTPVYCPFVDDVGVGINFKYAKVFLTENVYQRFNSPLSVEYYQPYITSYEQLENIMTQYDPELYNYMASVAIKQYTNGTYSFTISEKANHMLEITGTNNGYINCWTWGRNGITSEKNCYIHRLMVLKRSEIGIQEKITKQQLSCNCEYCTNNGSDSCKYNW